MMMMMTYAFVSAAEMLSAVKIKKEPADEDSAVHLGR